MFASVRHLHRKTCMCANTAWVLNLFEMITCDFFTVKHRSSKVQYYLIALVCYCMFVMYVKFLVLWFSLPAVQQSTGRPAQVMSAETMAALPEVWAELGNQESLRLELWRWKPSEPTYLAVIDLPEKNRQLTHKWLKSPAVSYTRQRTSSS